MDIYSQIAAKRKELERHLSNAIQKSFTNDEVADAKPSVKEQIDKAVENELSDVYAELGLVEKAVYADTSENRKLGRVGQEYTRKKQDGGKTEHLKLLQKTPNKQSYHHFEQMSDKELSQFIKTADRLSIDRTNLNDLARKNVKQWRTIAEQERTSRKTAKKSWDNAIDLLKSAGSEELFEKAHKDGDMHPNGKWVWVSSAAGGKGDWRVKGGRIHKKSGATSSASSHQNSKVQPKQTTSLSSKVAQRKQVREALQNEFGTNLMTHGNMQGTPVTVVSNTDGTLSVEIGDRGASVVDKVEKVAKSLGMVCEKGTGSATTSKFTLYEPLDGEQKKSDDKPADATLKQIKGGRSTPSTLANLMIHNGTQAQIDEAKKQVSAVINASTDVGMIDATLNSCKKAMKGWADEGKPAWQYAIDECKKRKKFLTTEAGKFQKTIFDKLDYYMEKEDAADVKKYFIPDSKGLKRKGQNMYLAVETGEMSTILLRKYKQAITKMEAAGICHVTEATGHADAIMLPRRK